MHKKLSCLAFALCPALALSQSPGDTSDTQPRETIVVSASRTPRAIAETGSSITVLTREDLERSDSPWIADALRRVAGVSVSQSGARGSQTQIRIRGAEANHTLVLIDGVEVNDPAIGDEFQFEHLSTHQLERVEIVRGPQSALWGSDAVAGVINFVTRRSTEEQLSGNAYVESGSFGTSQIGGHMGFGADRFNFGLATSLLDSDGSNVSRTGTEDDGYSNASLNVTGGYRFTDELRVDLAARRVEAESQFDGTDFFVTGLPQDANLESEIDQTYVAAAFSLGPLNGRVDHDLRLTFMETASTSLAEGIESSSTGASKSGVYYQWSRRLSTLTPQRVTAALDHEVTTYDHFEPSTVFGDPNQHQEMSTNGYVFEYLVEPIAALDLSASVRHDSSSDFDAISTFRLSLSRSFGASRLRASAGTGQKSPTFVERFGYFPDQFTGNPALKPERSRGWEVGVEQDIGTRASFSATYFRERLEDEIDGFYFDAAASQFTAVNLDGASNRKGVELAYSLSPTKKLHLGGSYTYTDSTQPGSGAWQVRELRRPREATSLTIDYDATSRTRFGMSVSHNAHQLDTWFPPFPEPSMTVRLGGYTLASFSLSHRINDALTLYGRVDNALDETYEDVYGFNTPGRGIYLGLQAEL